MKTWPRERVQKKEKLIFGNFVRQKQHRLPVIVGSSIRLARSTLNLHFIVLPIIFCEVCFFAAVSWEEEHFFSEVSPSIENGY